MSTSLPISNLRDELYAQPHDRAARKDITRLGSLHDLDENDASLARSGEALQRQRVRFLLAEKLRQDALNIQAVDVAV